MKDGTKGQWKSIAELNDKINARIEKAQKRINGDTPNMGDMQEEMKKMEEHMHEAFKGEGTTQIKESSTFEQTKNGDKNAASSITVSLTTAIVTSALTQVLLFW